MPRWSSCRSASRTRRVRRRSRGALSPPTSAYPPLAQRQRQTRTPGHRSARRRPGSRTALGYCRNLMGHHVASATGARLRIRAQYPPGSQHRPVTSTPTWRPPPSTAVACQHRRCSACAKSGHGAGVYGLRGEAGPVQRSRRPVHLLAAHLAEGGALPPGQLSQRRFIQAPTAELGRQHQPGCDGRQVLIPGIFRRVMRRSATFHGPGLHRRPETTRLGKVSFLKDRVSIPDHR